MQSALCSPAEVPATSAAVPWGAPAPAPQPVCPWRKATSFPEHTGHGGQGRVAPRTKVQLGFLWLLPAVAEPKVPAVCVLCTRDRVCWRGAPAHAWMAGSDGSQKHHCKEMQQEAAGICFLQLLAMRAGCWRCSLVHCPSSLSLPTEGSSPVRPSQGCTLISLARLSKPPEFRIAN